MIVFDFYRLAQNTFRFISIETSLKVSRLIQAIQILMNVTFTAQNLRTLRGRDCHAEYQREQKKSIYFFFLLPAIKRDGGNKKKMPQRHQQQQKEEICLHTTVQFVEF